MERARADCQLERILPVSANHCFAAQQALPITRQRSAALPHRAARAQAKMGAARCEAQQRHPDSGSANRIGDGDPQAEQPLPGGPSCRCGGVARPVADDGAADLSTTISLPS